MEDKDSLAFTGERFVPGIEDRQLASEHYLRYLSVGQYVAGKVILDAACGEGYGSDLLAQIAERVIGIDISDEVIRHAQNKYVRNNLSYIRGAIADMPLSDQSIDMVVSFETIEHVPESTQARFLAEVCRVLKPDGQLVISTPNRLLYSEAFDEKNPFHVHEFAPSEFAALLSQYFRYMQIYQQTAETVQAIYLKERQDSVIGFANSEYLVDGHFQIAVASQVPVDDLDLSFVSMPWTDLHQQSIKRIFSLQDEVEERNQHIRRLDEEIEKLRLALGQSRPFRLDSLRLRILRLFQPHP